MAEERIDIEVNDKVDASIPTKLREIAEQADRGFTFVQRLKSALASVNATPVLKLAEASNAATNALARELTAQAKLTTAQASASVATAKAATEQQRLATETLRTAAAQSRAESAAASAQRATLALEQATARAAAQQGNLYTRAERLKAAIDPLYAAQQRFNMEINEANALLAKGAISMNVYQQAVAAADAKLKAANTTLGATTMTMQKGRFQTANIAAQMNDLGVQFAMAAQSGEPLKMVMMALIQQGSQLSYIASTMEGGWAGLGKTMLGMVARFWPVLVVIGLVTGALALLRNEANQDNGLKDYAKTLGLTADEMKKLEDVTVTYGDTAKAVFQVVGGAIWDYIGPGVTKLWGYMTEFFSWVGSITKKVINLMIGGWVGSFNVIRAVWSKLPAAIGDAFYSSVNLAIAAINWMIRKAVEGLNFFIREANKVLDKVGLGLPELTAGQISPVKNQYAGAGKEVGTAAADALSSALNRDYLGEFADAVSEQARKNARDRLKGQADKLKEDRPKGRTPKGGGVDEAAKAAERRAHALAMVNTQLDNELARMKLLKDERAIEQRMDQITEALAQKKITLNEAETASLREKVTAIEQYKYVQAEMDRIYEEATGPLRTMNASITAATDLYDRGKISVEQYSAELQKATRTYDEATDPLYKFNEALDEQFRLVGKYGVELERATYLESVRQDYTRRGLSLYDESTGKLKDEVAALVAKNDALRQAQYIQSQVAGVLAPILDQNREIESKQAVYDKLEELRQNDLIKESDYQRAKAALAIKYNGAQLNATADFFGALADVTKNGHGAIGVISKAAAVAQATIQGYVAVQNALSQVPYPFNFVAAAAVAIKTGAQVAGILSTNVGSYATGGQFIVGGRSGVDKNNINMNVTKGERVTVETQRQQRANDNQANGQQAPQVNVPVKVVAQFDPRMALDALDTAEGERLIISTVERNPQVFQRLMGSR